MKKRFKNYLIIFIFLVPILYFQNNIIVNTKYELEIKNLPNEFEGLKILHLSDLHNKKFGEGQYKLVSKVRKFNPDVIFMTGDMVTWGSQKKANFLIFLSQIKEYPIYYIMGNHEYDLKLVRDLKRDLKKYDVYLLDNKIKKIKLKDSSIEIVGISDPYFFMGNRRFFNKLNQLSNELDKSLVRILLSHRPELFDKYVEYNYDLVLSGHAHGGQIRLPFIGGLFAPHQGFFPKYTSGIYHKNNTQMLVSRGLGASSFPFRILNNPEFVEIILKNKEE